MACCLMFFDDAPIPDDPKGLRPHSFKMSLTDSITKGQPTCCITCLCPCCMNMYIRSKVLDHKLHRYTCCQGYMDCAPIFHAGMCGERSCPECCLCVESFICLGPSMSSSRMYVMDTYDLRPDPCDNRVVRFTNCLTCMACILDIIAIFVPCARDSARWVQLIANFVFYSTIGCMAAQVNHELDVQRGNTSDERHPIMSETTALKNNSG